MRESMPGMHAAPPTLYLLSSIPAACIKRKKMNVISLSVSVLQCSLVVLGALILSPPPPFVQPPSPPTDLK